MKLLYRCKQCLSEKPKDHTGMICVVCGGDYRPLGAMFNGNHSQIEGHYERAIGQYCTSLSDKEKKVKQYNKMQRDLPPSMKDQAHPDGVCFTQDSKHWNKIKDWKKNGKDMQASDRRASVNREEASRKRFAQGHRKIFITFLLTCFLFVGTARAERLLGVDYVGLTVEGETYEVPMYREDFRQQFYLIKRAVENNDSVARELILAGDSTKHIFIGDGEIVRWLIIDSQHNDRVIERKAHGKDR